MLIRNPMSSGSYGPALPELHKRLRWVALGGIAIFALLVGRLWQLQVMRGESYFERTVSNVVKERYLPSVRGKILDRKGVPLADNRPAFNIYATPKKLDPAVKAAASNLVLARRVGKQEQLHALAEQLMELHRQQQAVSG